MKQTIRIIGGLYRGKKLHFPPIEDLRPTPDRVRETLFNWLMLDIKKSRCLDAFAGSGALGFEAFSRGADAVTFLEIHPLAYQHLQQQISLFDSSKLSLKKMDAYQFLKHTKEHYDIIFLDPPFTKNYLPNCIELISENQLLVDGGLLYVESPRKLALDSAYWQELKSNIAGQVVYSLYKYFRP